MHVWRNGFFFVFFIKIMIELHWTGNIETFVRIDPSLHFGNGSAVSTVDTILTNETKENSATKYRKGC